MKPNLLGPLGRNYAYPKTTLFSQYCFGITATDSTELPITVAARSKAWTIFARSDPSRSQWPRRLRHELPSPSRMLGSWGRIPLEEWMSVCVYSVVVLSRMQVAALRRADHSCKESYRLYKQRLRNWRRVQGPTKGCRAIDKWLKYSTELRNKIFSEYQVASPAFPGCELELEESCATATDACRQPHINKTALNICKYINYL
jgi:hypothetical protein